MYRNDSLNNDGTFFHDNSIFINENSSKDNTKNSSNPEKEYKE
jgi:hypothetical protein